MIQSSLVLNNYETKLHNFKFKNEVLNAISSLQELLVSGIDNSSIHIFGTKESVSLTLRSRVFIITESKSLFATMNYLSLYSSIFNRLEWNTWFNIERWNWWTVWSFKVWLRKYEFDPFIYRKFFSREPQFIIPLLENI